MGLKILFDHQLFSYQKFGGASKYFAMLLNALPKDVWETTTILSNNEYVNYLNLFPHKSFCAKHYFRGQGRIMNELNKPYSIYRLRKQDYDVFHQTHFETYCLKCIGTKPMVTTFHDVNFSTFNPNKRIVGYQKKSLERADHIIAVSNNTKKDLVNMFNVREDKVSVIYHGIVHPKTYQKEDSLVSYPYILYIGTRGYHKNFERFVRAFALLSNEYPNVKVVCTFKPFTPQEIDFFRKLHVEERFVHFIADEKEINILYQNALFFIFPSLYEGFGMPILEAMVNRCPVVLSNASCFPEIAEDAALYFDPLQEEDICLKMKSILDDSILRESLISKGIDRVKEFSWKKCAAQHLEVYKSLL